LGTVLQLLGWIIIGAARPGHAPLVGHDRVEFV
jgi:hypothetical protein